MTKEVKVDLHIHSNASDGLFTSRELMRLLASSGLSAAGLTDHDTIAGLPEARDAAQEFDIELVPGVEISVLYSNNEIHILGYYPCDLEELKNGLLEVKIDRFKRMNEMVKKLQRLGFKIKPEEVTAEAGDAAPGRLHLARLLQKRKYVHTPDEAFKLYLNKGREAYVPRNGLSLKQAMDLLNDVRAIPVIAHPLSLGREIIEMLIPMGLQGIEAFHPEHSNAQVDYYRKLAVELGLIVTGGSDFHGDSKRYSHYSLQMAIPGHYLDELKRKRK